MSRNLVPHLGLVYWSLPFSFLLEVDHDDIGHLGSDNLARPPMAKPLAEDYLPTLSLIQCAFFLQSADIFGLTRGSEIC